MPPLPVVELADAAEPLAAVAVVDRAVLLVELLAGPDVDPDPAEVLREVNLPPDVVLRDRRVGEDAVVGDVGGLDVELQRELEERRLFLLQFSLLGLRRLGLGSLFRSGGLVGIRRECDGYGGRCAERDHRFFHVLFSPLVGL